MHIIDISIDLTEDSAFALNADSGNNGQPLLHFEEMPDLDNIESVLTVSFASIESLRRLHTALGLYLDGERDVLVSRHLNDAEPGQRFADTGL